MTPVSLISKFYVAGYCEHRGAMTLKGDRWSVRKYPATCVLIRHPNGRTILFDTGYSARFHTETSRFPFKLYAKLTPVTIKPEDEIVAQLKDDGIGPDDIDTIILSHFHADHMCGLKDFPNARIISTGIGYDHVRHLRGFAAIRRGFLPGLLPADFDQRFDVLESSKHPYVSIKNQLSVFENGWDILGDGSLLAVPLPGHARGQFGLFFHDRDRGYVFLIADATWSSAAFQENRKPHLLAYNALDDGRAYNKTLTNLHTLHRARPNIRIVPTHCSDAWALANEDAAVGKAAPPTKTGDQSPPQKALKWSEHPDADGDFWSRGGLKTYAIRQGSADGQYWLTEVGKSFGSVAEAKSAAAEDHLAHVRKLINDLRQWADVQAHDQAPPGAALLLKTNPSDAGDQAR
jgi:glyoxylase-like metal-dependent hydrolase (beta-lactamase superfamily II)